MKLKDILALDLGKNIIGKLTKYLTKNGRLKGKNKHETKALRAACLHHKQKNGGKIKPIIENDGQGRCYCEACEEAFQAKPFKDDELEARFEGWNEVVQQAKFLAAALDAGEDTEQYLATLCILEAHALKTYRKLRAAAEKRDKIHKKSKNKTQKYGGSSTLGGWK